MDKYYLSADIIVFFFLLYKQALEKRFYFASCEKPDLSSQYIANFGNSSKIFLKELIGFYF